MALMLRPHVGEAAGDAFVMFWLVVVMCVTLSEGVQCLTCKDNISPAHDTDACPLTTTVATNVAALTAVAGTVISVSKLLPIKVIRLFPRAILDALKAITQRPTGTFDYNGKTVQQVFQAAMHGHTSTDEALVWMQDQLLSAPNGTEVTRISKSMDLIKTMGAERYSNTQNVQGAHLYLWALTDRCVREAALARMSTGESVDDEQRLATFNLKLNRPSSYTEFMRRINLWTMFLHATGVENCLVVTPFLDDVVFAGIAKGQDWRVVHELLVIYLHMIEDYEDYTIAESCPKRINISITFSLPFATSFPYVFSPRRVCV